MTQTSGFTEWAAELTGMSLRSVEIYAAIGERLDSKAAGMLRDTAFADNLGELQALSRLERATQRRAAEMVTREKAPAKSIRAAIAEIEGRAAVEDPVDRQLAKLIDAWNRSGAKARNAFIAFLSEQKALG